MRRGCLTRDRAGAGLLFTGIVGGIDVVVSGGIEDGADGDEEDGKEGSGDKIDDEIGTVEEEEEEEVEDEDEGEGNSWEGILVALVDGEAELTGCEARE